MATKRIKGHDYLKCTKCYKTYDILKTNVSSKRFHLMTKETKDNWKCSICHHAASESPKIKKNRYGQSKTTKPDPQDDKSPNYVTLRKPRQELTATTSGSELEDHSTTIGDDTHRSLPNISVTENVLVIDLKHQINNLSMQLASAHAEIDKLNAETTVLKKALEEQQKKTDLYKSIMTGTTNLPLTPQRENKKCSRQSTVLNMTQTPQKEKITKKNSYKSSNNQTSNETDCQPALNLIATKQEVEIDALTQLQTENNTIDTLNKGVEEVKKNKVIVLGDQDAKTFLHH